MSDTAWQKSAFKELVDGLEAGVSVRSDGVRGKRPAILKTSSIAGGNFNPSECKSIIDIDVARARCSPKQGGIIVSRMNTPLLVGEVGYVDRDYPELFLPDRLWFARPRRDRPVDMRWLAYYLSSTRGSRAVRDLATGTSGSMKNIPKRRLLALELPVPPALEQRAIASALGDAEALIATLQRLVAKKEAIKQGMMRALLSGEIRLTGFSTPWREVRLGDVATMSSGGTPLSGVARYYGEGIPWVSISDITASGKHVHTTEKTLSRAGLLNSAAKLYDQDVVLYAMYASLGECALPVGPMSSSQAILGILPGDELDREFLYYELSSRKSQVKKLGQQGTQANLNAGIVRDFRLNLPPIGEQRSIAAILSNVDVSIEGLRQRLAKAKAVKQGMMQELLTGRTRLPVAEEAAA